jgi:hypothetical protein
MSFHVACECGSTQTVSATQAGTSVRCSCGRQVAVPALSVLRATSSEPCDLGGTLERIRDSIARGVLPANDVCPLSGRPADSVLYFRVDCEREWMRRGERSAAESILLWFLLGWIGLLLSLRRSGPPEVFGHDISIEVPLRVASQMTPKVRRMRRQRPLKNLLSQTDAYRQLFKEYPGAIITMAPAA